MTSKAVERYEDMSKRTLCQCKHAVLREEVIEFGKRTKSIKVTCKKCYKLIKWRKYL